jgi:hypothetical protein
MKLPASDNSCHNIDSVYHWHFPKHILAFLVNVLEDSTTIPKLAPWQISSPLFMISTSSESYTPKSSLALLTISTSILKKWFFYTSWINVS